MFYGFFMIIFQSFVLGCFFYFDPLNNLLVTALIVLKELDISSIGCYNR